MYVMTIVFQFALCLCLVLSATICTFRPKALERLLGLFPGSGWRRIGLSALLVISLLVTVIGMAVPFVAFFGSCLAFISSLPVMARAVLGKMGLVGILPLALAGTSVAVALSQPLGLRVLALPKAAELPYRPCTSRVVKTYDEGLWFEGIAAGDDGILYLSGNRGLDFSRGDFYHDAEGELIERKPDGNELVVFKTPRGLTAGVPCVGRDKSIYLTSHGERPCIWRIDTSGRASQIAQFPNGAWPNGLDEGPDGKLYTPDSHLGVIWRVDPANGRVEEAVRDAALSARAFVSLAPGANGLHFKGRSLLVTVSDRTTVLEYTLEEKGGFTPAKVIASGIPGDDFAIGPDGSLFITTHPYNTVVRIAPNGERVIVGRAEQHIVGATDAVFGRGAEDRNTLYVVTDGGAFTGGPKTRGELVALEPYGGR